MSSQPNTALDGLPWPPERPRVLVATCMKDEGPFILEWLAWQKAIGVTDIVVFTNDCSDGTDALLDRLDAMGELTHLPNPASLFNSPKFHPSALDYTQQMPVFREADFFLPMDVDEFLNIFVGDGTIADLLAAVPAFDVLSICETNHGANGQLHYKRGWLTEMFPAHESPRPGKWKARVGVKSLTRITDRIDHVHNHRPAVSRKDIVWLDGSGSETGWFAENPGEKGIDSRGRRGLATLDHFALRSVESYLVKMFRGDAVIAGKQVSHRYWRRRNQNVSTDHDLARGIARARKVHERFEADASLMALHEEACAAHEARIAELLQTPAYQERRDWILNEAW